MGRSRFSVPPSAARRLALSLAIKASRPRRTSDVFSLTPVSLAARCRRESSILRVVLICMSMHDQYILVKPYPEEITTKLTCRYGAQRNCGQVERLVMHRRRSCQHRAAEPRDEPSPLGPRLLEPEENRGGIVVRVLFPRLGNEPIHRDRPHAVLANGIVI